MIPEFPNFKKLEFSDRLDVEKIVRKYPPYSDFDFISMWSWNRRNGIRISDLNGNLVVYFIDYITDEPFYSFIGHSNINETAITLLKLAEENGLLKRLKLIPNIVAEQITPGGDLVSIEDPGNFDYMYELEKLMTYNGNKLRSKRNLSIRYRKLYLLDTSTKILNPSNLDERREILRLLETWIQNKKTDINENEFSAIHRVIDINEPQGLVFVGLFIKDILAGFVINEVLKDEHAILHFEKADQSYVGIYSYLMQENSKILYNLGKRILNYEQDLNIPGLRLAKKAFRPSYYLKKHIITYKTDSPVGSVDN